MFSLILFLALVMGYVRQTKFASRLAAFVKYVILFSCDLIPPRRQTTGVRFTGTRYV